jgi:hypothetical protein
MYTVLDIIHETYTGLPREDSSRLDLVEIRPKSEEFADVPLSASVSPNDPADEDGWRDAEIASPGAQYNQYDSAKYIEMGLGQYFNLRYTVDFTFFFKQRGANRDQSLVTSQLILRRIHAAIVRESDVRKGKLAKLRQKDDLGFHLVRGSNAVKATRMLPRGSRDETLYRGKMWLQFEAFLEV